MDARKWTERQTDKVWELCQHSDRDICPACVADAFAPTITKLVQALRASAHNHHKLMGYAARRDAYPHLTSDECATKDFEQCMNIDCLDARNALAELEKP